jgi:DNA-binding beta-propeller fold protein YncE
MALTNVTFNENSAVVGGGILNRQSSPRLTNVTFNANSAEVGGGVGNTLNSAPRLTNVTLNANSASDKGGGISNDTGSNTTLTNATLTGNSAPIGGGIANISGTVKLADTILAENTGVNGPDCSGVLTSQGYNLIGNNLGCTFTSATGDQVGAPASPIDPRLGPLQDNGGLTPTRALLPGSPALDRGSPAVPGSRNACAAADQRGFPRPQNGRCDIGAYESILSNTTSTAAGTAGQSGSTDGYTATARFGAPIAIATNAAGTFALVADSSNHNIRRIDLASGQVSTLAGKADSPGSTDAVTTSARFRGPSGVALRADGRLALIADAGNNTIRAIDILSGTVTTLAGTAGVAGSKNGITATAQFSQPVGIAMDAGGTFALVADTGNSIIRKLDILSGAVTTLAGRARSNGANDGVGTAARFYGPTGIALSADGNFALVVDAGNDAIRIINVATGHVTTLAHLSSTGGVETAASGSRIQLKPSASLDPGGCIGVIAV